MPGNHNPPPPETENSQTDDIDPLERSGSVVDTGNESLGPMEGQDEGNGEEEEDDAEAFKRIRIEELEAETSECNIIIIVVQCILLKYVIY